MTFTVLAYIKEESWSKAWLEVEASTPEEALELAKTNPEDYFDGDTKEIDGSYSGEFSDEDEWEIVYN